MPAFNSIDGLVSGLDTTSLIDSILAFERRNADLLEIQQAEKQAEITAYQSLQAKLLSLSTDLGVLSNKNTFEKAKIDISDSTVLSATHTGRVSPGTYNMQVTSLARNHQIASQGFNSDSIDSMGTGTITIKVGDGNSKTITIDSDNNTLVGIKDAINDANAGVNASIVNDGSSSRQYRLVLSANETGFANKINISSSLVGGDNLNYSTSSFDSPEELLSDLTSTSQVSLGTSAAFSGSINKAFTFTVAGTGSQTVGTDAITLDWVDSADPSNSGSIVVLAADSEYEVVGAEGLYLSFAAGTLNAGDTFQVGTFAPLLQAASDAKIAIGSTGVIGSPITVSSENNSFSNVIGGLNIMVNKETAAGESITVSTDIDVNDIKTKISSFIDHFNSMSKFIDEQNTYDVEAEKAPILFGDFTVTRIQSSLRRILGSNVTGIDSTFNHLYSIGIRTDGEGKLSIKDNTRLEDAIRNNLDDVIKLFSTTGNSSSDLVEFVSDNLETRSGVEYDVDITRAATHGGFRGTSLTDPATSPITITASNKNLKMKVDGLVSEEMVLTEGTYSSYEDLVTELARVISQDTKVGSRDITVEWVDNGDGSGYIDIINGSYGSASKIEIDTSISSSAFATLGLSSGTAFAGTDVEGTINGEPATGRGQILTGDEGNEYTEGLKLRVSLSEADLGAGSEAQLTVVRGIAATLKNTVTNMTAAGGGLIDSRIRSLNNQVDALADRVSDIDDLLSSRRESLYKQFYEMETILGQLNSQSEYLTSQMNNINANWGFKTSE